MRWMLGLAVCLWLLTGCESATENAGSTSGPGVDVQCLKRQGYKLLPGQGAATGVGDTRVDVQCAPS